MNITLVERMKVIYGARPDMKLALTATFGELSNYLALLAANHDSAILFVYRQRLIAFGFPAGWLLASS